MMDGFPAGGDSLRPEPFVGRRLSLTLIGAAAGLGLAVAPPRLRALGLIGGMTLAGALVSGAAGRSLRGARASRTPTVSAPRGDPRAPIAEITRRDRGKPPDPGDRSRLGATPQLDAGASRKLNFAASALAFSVVADSSLEHYRGGFHNPVMFAAPVVSGLTLWSAASSVARATETSRGRAAVFGVAAATGVAGTVFHLYNMGKREGGFSWLNLFYAAPVGAPLGITFAGIFGLIAGSLTSSSRQLVPSWSHRGTGSVLASVAAVGLVGTSAEAGLLHFRGAFHDPFMFLPVTLPPAAAVALLWTLHQPARAACAVARGLLWSTVGAGPLGMGFHAYGIHRNMGGWYNWSQMMQQGPPVPAPPSFTGMALAGLAAIDLLRGALAAEAND